MNTATYFLIITKYKDTGILNYTTLSKIFSVSDKTIKEYINYFEDVFLLKRLDKFHNKQKERIKSSKKIYASDNGFLEIATSSSKNFGDKLENIVFNILNQNCDELTYFKDGKEIDFKCKDYLYQVSYDISNEKTRKREMDAFKYLDSQNNSKHYIITYNENGVKDDIQIESLEQFILQPPNV